MKKIALTAIVFFIAGYAWGNRSDLLFEYQTYRAQVDAPQALARDEIEEIIPAEPEVIVEEVVEVATSTSEIPEPVPELPKSEDSVLPAEFNLKIPFTSQAPHANWDMPYQEACEEASVLMSVWFINGVESRTKDEADQEILELVAWQEEVFGFYKDTTVEETLRILHERFDLTDAYIEEDPTIKQVEDAVVRGYPVIVPAAGRLLDNPNFSGEGPLYHMLVIRGFTDTEFITNDPGTRRGRGYRYMKEHLMSVIHDWNGGDVEHGKKAVIVVKN